MPASTILAPAAPDGTSASSPGPCERGLLIVLEGGEATGKTTQARLLAARLEALSTREPGGTALGASLRELCLGDTHDPDPVAELLLMAADRVQHIAEVIEPALAAGTHVVCDRFTYSTVAYQGAGRGLDPAVVATITELATGGLVPDAVVVVAVSPEAAAARLATRGEPDRLERAGDAFHRRVATSFLAQAAADPRGIVIDGEGAPDDVAARVRAGLCGVLAWRCPLTPEA